MILLFTKFLQSLGFGGLLGGGIFGLIYLYFPDFFSPHISIEYFAICGAALGAAFHRAVNSLFVNFFYPFGIKAAYYTKILELSAQHRYGLIETPEFLKIKTKLDEDYFLNQIVVEKAELEGAAMTRSMLPKELDKFP